jgi:hypothetical protein
MKSKSSKPEHGNHLESEDKVVKLKRHSSSKCYESFIVWPIGRLRIKWACKGLEEAFTDKQN